MEDYQGGTPLANWTLTNFQSGGGHGNASVVMFATISAGATTAKALMNKEKLDRLQISPISLLITG